MPPLAPVITTVCVMVAPPRGVVASGHAPAASRWPAARRIRACSACTKACGRLPRSCRSVTSYSSEYRPGEPHAARLRSNQRAASTSRPCWCRASASDEAAQQEGALGVAQRPLVVPEPVGVAVLGELGQCRRAASRSVRGSSARQRAADRRQQQRRVQRRVVRRALPAAGRVHRVGRGVGHDGVRQRSQSRRLRLRAAARPRARRPATQVSLLCVQARLSISQIPASLLLPALGDRVGGDLRRPASRRSPAGRALAAAASTSSASPRPSSWNCRFTQLPTRSNPPG